MNDFYTEYWLKLVLDGKLKMEDLMTMTKEFHESLIGFQEEQGIIEKNSKGQRSLYANWAQLRGNTKDNLAKNGIAITQHPAGDSYNLIMVTYLHHKNGYTARYESPMIKEKEFIDPQKYGGLITYIKRYTYSSILGIADSNEEDLDSQRPGSIAADGSTKSCPKCNKPLKQRSGKSGPFMGCSGYPTCKYTEQISEGPQQEMQEQEDKCPRCNGELYEIQREDGPLVVCANYPECQ